MAKGLCQFLFKEASMLSLRPCRVHFWLFTLTVRRWNSIKSQLLTSTPMKAFISIDAENDLPQIEYTIFIKAYFLFDFFFVRSFITLMHSELFLILTEQWIIPLAHLNGFDEKLISNISHLSPNRLIAV